MVEMHSGYFYSPHYNNYCIIMFSILKNLYAWEHHHCLNNNIFFGIVLLIIIVFSFMLEGIESTIAIKAQNYQGGPGVMIIIYLINK